MTRKELSALVADILAIHVCPCCLDSMPGRVDTIMLAVDQHVDAVARRAAEITAERITAERSAP